MDQKISVSIEVMYFPTSCLAENAIKTPKLKGYFGVRLKALTEREKPSTNVPLLVLLCVDEVEKRGKLELGTYVIDVVLKSFCFTWPRKKKKL